MLAAVTFAPFLLENENFLGFSLLKYLSSHLRAGYQRRADFHLAITADEKHIAKANFLTHLASEFLNLHHVPFRNAVLFTARSNYCVRHRAIPRNKQLEEIPSKVNLSGDMNARHAPRKPAKAFTINRCTIFDLTLELWALD